MPGSGKTTLAFQFLIEGVRRGEPVLYVTLSETREEIRAVAESHGWSLDGHLDPRAGALRSTAWSPSEQYTVFHPSEVELSDTTKKILDDVEQLKPARIVFDSLSELRLLAGNPLRYRRQILALEAVLRRPALHGAAARRPDGGGARPAGAEHRARRLLLEHTMPAFGAPRRRLQRDQVSRAAIFAAATTTTRSGAAGSRSFRAWSRPSTAATSSRERLPSGLAGLDKLLGGGLERGTSTLIVGRRGHRQVDARRPVLRAAPRSAASTRRCSSSTRAPIRCSAGSTAWASTLRKHVDAGLVSVQQVDPAELSPGRVRACHPPRGRERHGARSS